MALSTEQRRLLGAFLRKHRERLTPQEAGIRGGSARRRTPGLRREEVAQLCGLSPTWYAWIEQARDVSVSPAALARLAEALHLTAAERAYLFELACKRDPEAPHARPSAHETLLISALPAISTPAYVLDRLWQACGWNAAAARLFAGWLRGSERSLLRYVFLDAEARDFICGWEDRARRLVAEFRADIARHMDDPVIACLVEDLGRASPQFAAFWQDHGVLAREGGARAFNHPEDGLVHYEQLTLSPMARSDYKLVVLIGPTPSAAR